jgi:ribosomal protein RSM22 (predicted rRNA methylase)
LVRVKLQSVLTAGEIVRMTIPKSLSKQAFYDARKTAWGDLFPHQLKGALVLRTGKSLEIPADAPVDQWPVAELDKGEEGSKESDTFVKTFG